MISFKLFWDNEKPTPFIWRGQKNLFSRKRPKRHKGKLLEVSQSGITKYPVRWDHITFVKTHQDGLMPGTEALYRSEVISPGSPSRWALLSACLDLPSLVTQHESGSVAKYIRLSGTLEYYTDNRGDKGVRQDECLSQVRIPRISCRQLFGGCQLWRVTDWLILYLPDPV